MDDFKIFKNIGEQIQNALNQKLTESSNNLLHDIYEILPTDDKLLLNKQITPEILFYLQPTVKIDLSYNYPIKSRMQSDPNKRCLARVGALQCSRGRIQGPDGMSEFCNGHIKSLPYGRIDGPLEGKALKLKQTSGRKAGGKKQKIAYSMIGLDTNDYIKTEKFTFENKDYLVDELGIFYSCDATNNIVAQIKDDKIYWFT